MRWTAEELATAAGGRLVRRGERTIAGAFIDSRAPVAGGLFVPVVAARDGHDFIPAALAGGAAAVLCSPGRGLPDGACTVVEVDDTLVALGALAARARDAIAGPVVAVTGSNGKTTTRAMIAAVLATRYGSVLATAGNFNNHLGVPLTLLGEPHAADAAVIELGMSAPGENDRLGAIVRPDVAVITSVASEHLEFMGSLAAIAAAEAEVVAHLRPGGLVVVPDDEPLLDPHVPAGVRSARFGAGGGATVRILGVEQDERTHVVLRLRTPAGEEEVRLGLALFGAHNARNAAAALTVGLALGCPVPAMIAALEAVQPVGDRRRAVQWGPHLVIADCHNANPGSMAGGLTSLAAIAAAEAEVVDTVGVAEPADITNMFSALIPALPQVEFGAHLHCRPDNWKIKTDAAWNAGCRRFDGAINGYGGCPMAEDELVGNLQTELFVGGLEERGILTGLDREQLAKCVALAGSVFPA